MLLGYTRVSTEEQARDGASSLQAQERVIRGIAMARGITQFEFQIFSDPGVSGALPLAKRPAGSELIAVAKKGDVVIASALDRIFRSARDALNVSAIFKEQGIDLILANFGIEPVAKSAMAEAFFTFAAAFANLEHSMISERTWSGRRAKRARGGHSGGLAPYGMRVEGKGREAVLVPDEAEQKFLADLAELKNYYLCDITREINARGYRNRLGKPFDSKTIFRLLPADARVKAEEGFKKPNAYFGSLAARNSLHAVV